MYFDSCLPKVQVKLSNLLVYEGLATISLTFTSQARKAKTQAKLLLPEIHHHSRTWRLKEWLLKESVLSE